MLGWVHNAFILAITLAIALGSLGWVGGELTNAPGKFNLAPTFKFLLALGKSTVKATDAQGFDYDKAKPVTDTAVGLASKAKNGVADTLNRYQGVEPEAVVPQAEQPGQAPSSEPVAESPTQDNRLLGCPRSSIQNAEARVPAAKVAEVRKLWETGQIPAKDLIEIQMVWGEPACIFGTKWWRYLSDDGFGIIDVKDAGGSIVLEFSN